MNRHKKYIDKNKNVFCLEHKNMLEYNTKTCGYPCSKCYDDDAKKVFDMLGFQYKPLEKRLLKDMPELETMYKAMSYSKKIKALDMYASQVLGL